MPQATGPTIARWQLGEQLSNLRRSMGLAWDEVAQHLSCSEAKVRRIEKGEVGIVKAELNSLLDLYKVNDSADRERLLNLQSLGKQRGWWSKLGGVTSSYAEYLSIESAATMIRNFEPQLIPGLFQTEAYTRSLFSGINVHVGSGVNVTTAERVESQVRIRRARQDRAFGTEHGPSVWLVLDEMALRRPIGSAAIMRGQLEHLIAMAERCGVEVQVLPMGYGAHPGLYGPFVIFEFPDDLHSPVLYVESQAGNLYIEKNDDLTRCKLAFDHLTAAAPSSQDSLDLLRSIARDFAAQGGPKG